MILKVVHPKFSLGFSLTSYYMFTVGISPEKQLPGKKIVMLTALAMKYTAVIAG